MRTLKQNFSFLGANEPARTMGYTDNHDEKNKKIYYADICGDAGRRVYDGGIINIKLL